MDGLRDKAYRSWAKLLNPEILRANLMAASIFLVAYEILRTSVIERIRGFLTHEFDSNGSIISDKYKKDVLSLAKSPLRASLLWLKGMSVLDDSDIRSVDAIREHRNELAHDLPKFVATVDAEINTELLASIYDLVAKIDRWWIREVDLPCDPEFDGREIADDEIHSGNVVFMQLLISVATGGKYEGLWEQFQSRVNEMSESDKGPS
ncbi:MAG TPA: hypothetical protein VK395_05545 [Gemmataceae bacterium]|nr:hypothetical protein [Gemmataceae bacterium]